MALEFSGDGYIASTTLKVDSEWVGPRLWKILTDHRFMTQHQLTLTSTTPISGVLQVRILPDTGRWVVEESVYTDKDLVLDNEYSAVLLFSGVLKGIELYESTALTAGAIVTIVLSSIRGDGLVPSVAAVAETPTPSVPAGALVDRDGNPVLDRDGNYIIVGN